jgi:hypothetical protein
MPGIDLKQMWATLRSILEAIWKPFEAWFNDPFEITQRGLVSSGILSPASTQGALGVVWTVFVWFATLPLLTLAYLTALALALPGIIGLWIWRLVNWPFTPRQPKPTPTPPAQSAGISWVDTLTTVPPGASRLQYLWRIPLAIVLVPVFAFLTELAESLFLWIILLGFGMWVILMLGILFLSGSLFSFGVMIGRDNSPADSNSFTTVCNYRNLTQRDMISMTFDTNAARNAFSCPAFKRMAKDKK